MSGQLCERIHGLFGSEEASDCTIRFYLSPNEPRGGGDDGDGDNYCDSDVYGASGGDHGGGGADTTVGDNDQNGLNKGRAVAATPPPPSPPSAVRFVGSPLPAHSLVLWAASERFRAQLDRWRGGGWGHDDGCCCYCCYGYCCCYCSPLGASSEVTTAMHRSEVWELESYGLGEQVQQQHQQRKRERQQCKQCVRQLPPPWPPSLPWSQCHRIELRVPLGSEEDRFGALAALQYMYTGDLPGAATIAHGGGGVRGTDPWFSVTDLLAIRSQSTYLQVSGCAEACDRALLQILRMDDAAQQAAAEGPGGKPVLCGLRGQGSGSRNSSCGSIPTPATAATKQLNRLGDAAGGISSVSGCDGRKTAVGTGSRSGGGGGGGGIRADTDASPATLRDGVVAILQFAERCPAAASAASFLQVVDACRRHLVMHLPDALVVLNSQSLRQQFVELPACALEVLLGCSGFRTDNEASVLQLLAVWLAANPDTPPARCTALCRRIRTAHLGRAYLAFVLPYVAWWPLGYRQQLRALHLVSATAAERRALSELEAAAMSTANDDDVDAWCSAPPREPSDNVVTFRWNVARKALLQAILTSGDAAVTFDDGAEAVSMGGFEWRVFVKPPRSAGGGGGGGGGDGSGFGNDDGSGNGGGDVRRSGGDGSSGAPKGGRAPTAAGAAGVYLICKVPAELECSYHNPGTSSREAEYAAAVGGAGDGGDGRRISGVTSIPSGSIEIFHGRTLASAPLTQMAPNRRLGDSQQLAFKFYGGAASSRSRTQTWASLLSRPDPLMLAAATAPTPLTRQPHHPYGGDDGGDDVAAVVRFGSHEVFKFGSGAPGRGICDVLPLRATDRKSVAAVNTTVSAAATMAASATTATAATAATASKSVPPTDADGLVGDPLSQWLPYLQALEMSGSGGGTAASGGGLSGTLTLRTR